jgi:DNA-binding NarL/FixJ family response regulator
MPVRILLADDSKSLRNDLRTLLDSKPGWKVVAEAADGREALEKTKQVQPDVIVIDYSMPEIDGISAIPMIRGAAPQAEIVVLTVHDAPFTVRRAVDAGARAYVVKTEIIKNLVPAVEAASQHRAFIGFPGFENHAHSEET